MVGYMPENPTPALSNEMVNALLSAQLNSSGPRLGLTNPFGEFFPTTYAVENGELYGTIGSSTPNWPMNQYKPIREWSLAALNNLTKHFN